MHELGIAKDLFEIALLTSKKNRLKIITKITVKIGEASGIEEDFLRHSFVDHLIPGTIAENCRLEISKEKVKARCKNCSSFFSPEEVVFACRSCRSKDIEIISGKDVYITSIEGE